MDVPSPLKAIRQNCLSCSEGSPKEVAYCACDGVRSHICTLWPFRFGRHPRGVADERFITPGALPGSEVPIDQLPTPKPGRKPTRKMSDEQKQAARERMQRMHEQRKAVPR